MGFTRGIKRPIELICKRLSGPVQSGYGSHYPSANPMCGICSRSYSTEISDSEKTELMKELRQRTSAPFKDVKAALVNCNWQIEEALKELRIKGIARASKKVTRTAAEGFLALAQNESKATVIELNCETDFVARNEIFQYLASSLANLALLVDGPAQPSAVVPLGPDCLENLKMNFDHPKLNGEKTVQSAITEVAAMMGENVKLRRGFAMASPSLGVLSTYLHTSPRPGVGRMAGLLSLEVEDQNASVDALGRVGSEIAMHIVAAKPLFLTRELISQDAMDKELEIVKTRATNAGRNQTALDVMVERHLKKYCEEVVLVDQKFIVDETLKVKAVLDNLSKEVGSPVKIGNFLRMEVGEGLDRFEASDSEPLAQAA